MTIVPPPTSVAVLEGAVTWTFSCLQLARTIPLSVPTPCREWNLGELLAHMEDSLSVLGDAAELGRVRVDSGGPVTASGELVDRLVRRACVTLTAWQERLTSAPVAVGELVLGRDTIALVGALEIAVHGWDVAVACGHPRPLPEELAAQLHGVALAVVTREERGRRFAAPRAVPPSSSASVRLLAHLGRDHADTGQEAT